MNGNTPMATQMQRQQPHLQLLHPPHGMQQHDHGIPHNNVHQQNVQHQSQKHSQPHHELISGHQEQQQQIQQASDAKQLSKGLSNKKKVLRIPKEWKLKYGRQAHSSSGTFDEDAETRLIHALQYVQASGQNITEAAKRFGVPRSTLNERLKRDDPFAKRVRGTHPTLTKEEEDVMCKWLVTAYRRGHAITPKRFATAVKELLDGTGRANVFANDNKPTSGWVKTFRRRHPAIRFIKHDKWNDPKNVPVKSVGWFDDLLEHLHEEKTDPMHLLVKPNENRVFCLTEYGVGVHYDGSVVDTMVKNDNQNKLQKFIHVISCVNAAGEYLKPCLLYPDHVPRLNAHQLDLSSFHVGVHNKAWITHESLYFWLQFFVHHLDNNKIPRPVLLLINGEYSMATLPMCDVCAQAGIILHVIPKIATDFIHPLDVSFFENLGVNYRECFMAYMQTYLAHVTMESFPLVFMEAWNKTKNPDLVKNGFHASGIVSLTRYNNDRESFGDSIQSIYNNNCLQNRTAPNFERSTAETMPSVYACAVQSAKGNADTSGNSFEKLTEYLTIRPPSEGSAPQPEKHLEASAAINQASKKKLGSKRSSSKGGKSKRGGSSNIEAMTRPQKDGSSTYQPPPSDTPAEATAVKYESPPADMIVTKPSYTDGLNTALQAVIGFVPGPVRSIYQDWIEQGIDSETRDPVFLVWRRIDTMLKATNAKHRPPTSGL